MTDITRIADLLAGGTPFCLATIVASAAPDALPGLKAIVLEGGAAEADDWPARFDPALRTLALETLAGGQSRSVEIEPGVLAFFDVITAMPTLLICGAGHIALPLARFTAEAGFRVTVLDDRPDFASAARFPGCEVIADGFTAALRAMTLGPSAYAAIITRGHEHDAECLAEILLKKTAYTGLIGSRRRVAFVLDLLARKGIPRARLDEVFTPIGLPIGSESPEEIALSIAAELVCVRRLGARATRALRTAQEESK